MRKPRLPALLLLLWALLPACAPVTYQVQVNGYTDPALSAPILPGATCFVVESKEAKNPLLEREIKAKITKLLENRGHRLVPFEAADFYFFFSYGLGTERQVTVTMPDSYPGWGFGVGYGFPSAYAFIWPSLGLYPTQTQTYYDRWLLLNVVEGKHYRATGKFRAVWVGETRSTGTSSDVREVVNSLLLAAFEQFGKNTGKAVKVEINAQDPRLQELQGVR